MQTFNYSDYQVYLRLMGLAAVALLIFCLGIIEFAQPKLQKYWAMLTLPVIGSVAIISFVVIRISGAN